MQNYKNHSKFTVIKNYRFAIAATILVLGFAQSSSAYHISDDGETVILMGATIQEYDHVTNLLAPQLRVRAFDVGRGYYNADIALYSAVFEPNDENVVVHHRVGLTVDQLNSAATALHGKVEMMQVDAYALDGEERFGFLAYERSGPAWELFVDVPSDWIEPFEDSLPPGMNIVNRCKTEVWPSNTTTLYKKDNTETIDMNASMTEHEFKIMREILAAEGFRVTSMHIDQQYWGFYPTPFFRPIFKRGGNLSFSTHAFSNGIPAVVATGHELEVPQMKPMWIVNVQYFATDANGHYINDDDGSNHGSYMCGFRGQAKFNQNLKPGGNYKPELHAPSLPVETAKPSYGNVIKAK